MDKNNEQHRPVLDRVNTELTELGDKVDKLFQFTRGEIFNDLDEAERVLLTAQLGAMQAYHAILHTRLLQAGYVD